MAKRRSKRQASQKATARIKANILKSKPPRGMLKVPKVNRTKRPAAATKTESKVTHNASKAAEAGILISAIRHADDPIQLFNECEECDKRLLIENLLLSHRKLAGFPLADHALAGEAKLLEGDKEEPELVTDDDESDIDEDPRDQIKTMHGQPCWSPPPTSGICSRPVTVDLDGYVDLQHDAYCLFKHFTTQWGVPMDQDWRPAHEKRHRWSDWDWRFEAEGKYPGLRVDLHKFPRTGYTPLIDLISSQLLLYRITLAPLRPQDKMATSVLGRSCF
ncbi:hypothetical protein F5883DRAFT_41576 [Diaporthe sp. PMI_573]|nr:hypothetical protein F5883DRAFT_41576 [Diaporthaceae sp. PMI_573]